MLLVAGAAESADKKKPPKEEPKTPATSTEEKPAKPALEEAGETSTGAGEGKESAAGGEEFGSGRKRTGAGKKIDEATLVGDDKEKAKYVKALKKRFKDEEAFYVINTLEEGFESSRGPGEPATPEDYRPYQRMNFHVCAGQDEAVAFVVEFMSEHGAPWEKKPKASRKKNAEAAAGPPKPVRDWQLLDFFRSEADAEAFRSFKQKERDEAQLRERERNPTPR
jgi:hypothetical protein